MCGAQVLDLTDYDTGLPISRGDIKSFSHRRIRVTYKPKEVGDFTYIIHLQNNFDERNSKLVPFRCIVSLHSSALFFAVDIFITCMKHFSPAFRLFDVILFTRLCVLIVGSFV